MTIWDTFSLSLKVFEARLARTLFTISSTALGVGFVLFLVSLGYGLQYILIGRLATTEDSLLSLEVSYPSESGKNISFADLEKIKSLAEVGETSTLTEFPGELQLINSSNEKNIQKISSFVFVRVVPYNYLRLSGLKPDFGFVPNEKDSFHSLLISDNALKALGLPYDSSVIEKSLLSTAFYVDEKTGNTEAFFENKNFKISGVIKNEASPPFVIIFSEPNLFPPFFQKVLVKGKTISDVEIIRDKLIGFGFLVTSRLDLVKQVKKIMSAITIVLGAFGVAALIVSAIGMFNTMFISFMERIFEIGIMKAIGAFDKDIRNLFLIESLMIGFLGGVGGVLVGILLGEAGNLGINLLAKNLGGQPIVLFIRPGWFMIFILIVSSIVGLAAGFFPAQKATKVSPKEAFTRK